MKAEEGTDEEVEMSGMTCVVLFSSIPMPDPADPESIVQE